MRAYGKSKKIIHEVKYHNDWYYNTNSYRIR